MDNDKYVATFTAAIKPLEYYNDKLWKYPAQPAIYVSHLAVLPKFQHKGIGTWCMDQIEELALKRGCTAVRLDAFEKYRELLEFYDNLGYQRRKVVEFSGCRLVCMEKIIGESTGLDGD
jgi:GNAT superfamily N-acetyltransferase